MSLHRPVRSIFSICCLFATLIVIAQSGFARAGSITDFKLMVGPTGSEVEVTFEQLSQNSESVILPDADSSMAVLLNGSYEAGDWSISWDRIEFDPDPIVNFVGGFSNLSAVPMDFTLSTISPVTPVGPSSLIGGATTVTVTDANFDGVGTLKNIAGLPGYSGTFDGVNVLDLLNPFSISVPFIGGVNLTSASVGLPGPTLPSGPVAATIGITHRFNLTGNDNATFNSTFQVISIPEPVTIVLLAIGGLAATMQRWTRRRRRRMT